MAQEAMVYVVDDDVDIRRMICASIEAASLRAQGFGTAEEFLEVFDPACPGCLILDFELPGMNDLEVLDHLNAKDAGIPVIVISGTNDSGLDSRALDAGAWAFLKKTRVSDRRLLIAETRAALRVDARRRGRLREQGVAGRDYDRQTEGYERLDPSQPC